MTPRPGPEFDLADFLPYLLNQAAEAASFGFRSIYRNEYGMLRTEWRTLFHLGRYGEMTATEIGKRSTIHKTKISRAVSALEAKRFIIRRASDSDRRSEALSLTASGRTAYRTLALRAAAYDRLLSARFSRKEEEVLRKCLKRLGD